MAVGLSAYFAHKILDHCLRGQAWTPPTTIYARLHTGDPGAAGTSDGSALTTRIAVTYGAATGGAITLTNTPEFTLNATETITHVSFWDAATSGNFLWSAAASASKGGSSGDIIRLSAAALSFTPISA